MGKKMKIHFIAYFKTAATLEHVLGLFYLKKTTCAFSERLEHTGLLSGKSTF